MHKRKYSKKSQLSVRNIMYRAVGILLVLTMLSVWFVSGLYAKYVISVSYQDSASVASIGSGNLQLREHEAELITDEVEAVQQDGVYKLNNTKVKGNTYDVVLPGVDIPKDPFIEITGEIEVPYELYLKVVKKDLPDTVTYEMADGWKLEETETSQSDGIVYTYKYNKVIDSQFSGTIYILKNNKLIVKEKYIGNGKKFTLTFDAWLAQKKAD